MKVYELSKELNIANKELIKILQDLGYNIKSHLNVIDEDQVNQVKDAVGSIPKTVVAEKPKPQPQKRWQPDLDRMINVKNISKGKLVYKSKRQMGYTIIWETPGSTNYIELGELINLKNTDSRFVREPWIRIMEVDEIEILKYMNVYKYYKEMIEINDVANLFKLNFNKFQRKFDNLPSGYKETVAETAAKMITEGKLDSIKIKKYIEEKMGLDLDFYIKVKTRNAKSNNWIDIG